MKATIKNVEGLIFVAKSDSNHWAAFDGPVNFEGTEAASRPMEGLLMSLGACTGSDVKSIISKMRIPLAKFEIEIDAKRAEEHPKVFTEIKLTYKFWGKGLEDKRDKLEKAINLSQDKYCPISAMLAHSVKLQHDYEIYEA